MTRGAVASATMNVMDKGGGDSPSAEHPFRPGDFGYVN